MTNLGCDVTTCAYNCDNLCRRSSILVEGSRASKKDQTFCSSFEPKEQAFTNNVRCSEPDVPTDVSCKANLCTFNADGLCSARQITVCTCGCSDPCCADETECASFRCVR